jgi:lysophospholipase L1-like esterase
MKHYLYLLLFFLAACNTNSNQEGKPVADQPFWNDIQNFKKQDSVSFPPKNAILLIGSSSFTKWTDVQDYFPGYTIINRGFGGSTLLDQLRYEKDIIFPYHPKQIVIYCGENDLASSDSVTAENVFERFLSLYNDLTIKLPGVSIAFISLKPSPSRRHLFLKMRKANQLIKDYLSTEKSSVFIDIHQPMLGTNGEPLPEIFLDDSLHMNAKGYAIWKKEMEPYMQK